MEQAVVSESRLRWEADPEGVRTRVRRWQADGLSVGLVPTMGNLHAGHLSLVRASVRRCDRTVLTLFVNPTQFGPNEDLSRYPRTPEQDRESCEAAGVDLVFAPDAATMYPEGAATGIHVGGVSAGLCGAARPGHFDGVATVVAKLFNVAPADVAFFGAKDWQQTAVLRRMTLDLNFPVELVVCPVVREADGLALSSRNAYLDAGQRRDALALHRALDAAGQRIAADPEGVAADQVLAHARKILTESGRVEADYVALVDPDTVLPVVGRLRGRDRPVLLALAAKVGPTRLIDNRLLDPATGRSLRADTFLDDGGPPTR